MFVCYHEETSDCNNFIGYGKRMHFPKPGRFSNENFAGFQRKEHHQYFKTQHLLIVRAAEGEYWTATWNRRSWTATRKRILTICLRMKAVFEDDDEGYARHRLFFMQPFT
jgi:hypothetical protein